MMKSLGRTFAALMLVASLGACVVAGPGYGYYRHDYYSSYDDDDRRHHHHDDQDRYDYDGDHHHYYHGY